MSTRGQVFDLHEHGAEKEDFAHAGHGAVVLGGELVAEVVVGGDGTDGTDGTDYDGGGFGFHCAKWVVEWGGMNDLEKLAEQLESAWGGQTLATLSAEASREMNGTCFKAIRQPNGPRRILIFCVTGEHEQEKMGRLSPKTEKHFGDWSSVSLFEAVVSAIMAGGFCYAFDANCSKRTRPVVLIAAVPDSIMALEKAFALQP